MALCVLALTCTYTVMSIRGEGVLSIPFSKYPKLCTKQAKLGRCGGMYSKGKSFKGGLSP